jgi:hypothetical protein
MDDMAGNVFACNRDSGATIVKAGRRVSVLINCPDKIAAGNA